MQIIVIHRRQSQVRSFTLTPRVLAAAGALCLAAVLAASAASWHLARGRSHATPPGGADAYLRDNLTELATRVGELQAQMVRLDALGARVSGLAGIAPQDFDFQHPPGRGGPLPPGRLPALTLPELRDELRRLREQAATRADYFDVLEAALLDREMRERRLPRVRPVAVGYDASGFGTRLDPFTGRRVRHEGVDFAAPSGTPIVAAAGGVVVAAEFHPEYGNLVDIDHGDGLRTRYAHASAVLVKAGDLVRPGQAIARVGSTGRSTGPHLHFEVHVNGVPRNPHGFLQAAAEPPAAAVAARPEAGD